MYVCPMCHKALDSQPGNMHCGYCDANFPIIDDIPIFSNTETYYGEIERDKIQKLIENATKNGYKQALSEFVDDPFVRTYVLDESRAKWLDILSLDNNARFLDIGCGWGTNSIPASRRSALVAAVDATFERVRFVKVRAAQSGCENVIPALASATKLPYSEDYFDIVAFNGVLEWLGAEDLSKEPSEIQLTALREANRVLKPGGKLYVGIENRFSLRYILGQPDDHSFIRFTSLMPRMLANLYCRIRLGGEYFMHTHSLSQYRKFIVEAGFHQPDCYFPWPNYRRPEQIVFLEKENILNVLEAARVDASFRNKAYLSLLRALTRIEGKGRFCHSFCFVAQKPLSQQ